MDTLSHYDFLLPEHLIATTGKADRTASRLLVLEHDDSFPRHDRFKNIGNYLKPGDVLVINNTKVMKARIFAYKKTGGRVEILLVRPLPEGKWAALINGKGPFLAGAALHLGHKDSTDTIHIIKKSEQEQGLYELFCAMDLASYAADVGEMPLPPYFRRKATHEDEVRYQTVYAKELGAVAAPTAGLHFTEALLADLKQQGVVIAEVTLHVGPGTFLPIRHEDITKHTMHTEFFHMEQVCADALNHAQAHNHRIIAVGTTSVRVLEQCKQSAQAQGNDQFCATTGQTALFIRPGYKFLACNGLITNFHLPRSTLLLLVSAAVGRERVLAAYQEAIAKEYQFFSYGDACFFEIGPIS